MTACSAIEAELWRASLDHAIALQSSAVVAGRSNIVQLHSPLANEMRSIGAAFGKPGSIVRRMSVHRSQTVGPNTDLNQVMIKNTQAVKDALSNASSLHQVLTRSQSVATPSHVQTLAPRRQDRVRLESLLADVWSPSLPYPGMTIRRTEQLRGSANHVIRKLSMASITSTFYPSRRNGSHASMTKVRCDAAPLKVASSFGQAMVWENAKPGRLPLTELLPADFDLREQPSKQKRRNALRALTMTMERPFSPLFGSAAESYTLQRAQSVRVAKDWPIVGYKPRPAQASSTDVLPCEPDQTTTATKTIWQSLDATMQDGSGRAAKPPASLHAESNHDRVTNVLAAPKKMKSKIRLRRWFG